MNKIVEYLPAEWFCRPPINLNEWTVCHQRAVQNDSLFTGALVRNKHTGIYCIYSSGALANVNQKFAKSIDQTLEYARLADACTAAREKSEHANAGRQEEVPLPEREPFQA